jgi:hypothetical protein
MDDELSVEQAEAMDFLSPLMIPLHEGWHSAVGKYQSYAPEHIADHDDTAAAICIRCHMWTYVQNQIQGMPGVALLDARGLRLVNYFDRYVIRLKQVDGRGRHANYPTDQQVEFDKDIPLPGIPRAAIRVTSGYQLNEAADAIERIMVARILDKSTLWLSQVNVVAAEPVWEDITPQRLPGTARVDARFRRAGR